MEIVESGALAAVLVAFKIPQEYIATLVVIKGTIKTYLLRNAVVKKDQSKMTTIDETTLPLGSTRSDPVLTQSPDKLTMEDRVGALVDSLNKSIVANGGKRFEREGLITYIKGFLTKPEKEIREEALSTLTDLQRKSLGW